MTFTEASGVAERSLMIILGSFMTSWMIKAGSTGYVNKAYIFI